MFGALFLNEKNHSYSTNESTSVTESEVGRKLLMPDEILQLSADTAIILTKGVPPILARIARYYEAPELAHLMPDVGRAN